MKISGVSEWLTIGTNLAVLAGIAALVYEIGQNTRQLRAQASYNLLSNRIQTRTEIATNPEIAEFWQRVASGEPLSATDASRVRAAAEIVVLKIHWEYGQYIDGNLALSELPVSAYRSAFRGGEGPWLSGLPDAWLALKGQLRPDFVAWIEEEVIK